MVQLGSRPEIEISFTAKAGYLEEHLRTEKVFEPEAVAEIEKALSADLEEMSSRVIEKQQEYGSDIFGIGSYLAAFYPAYMNSVDWEEIFPQAKVRVIVDVRLDRVGIRQN
ncbi:MAG: Ger(x)C family spore germination C-terminal domain-containing protein [bacterium]